MHRRPTSADALAFTRLPPTATGVATPGSAIDAPPRRPATRIPPPRSTIAVRRPAT
ncbi:MAG: hypothetical protein F2520_12050 [Actinobacteria bacterium]|nr:hypothetical protein [Actinomycetota bacterium]